MVKVLKSFEVEESYPDAATNIAMDTLRQRRQALIFCNTKRGAESQAEKIASKIKFDGKHDGADNAASDAVREKTLVILAESVLQVLSSPTKQCQRLALCVRKGVAFHHSGLAPKQREIIETAFRESTISIICATPTLAMGMDLPAYRSVIRDLKRFSQGTSWGMSEIPVLEYEQMAGRAGRPGKERNGEAICIAQTDSEKEHIVEKYLLGEPEQIYSKLAVEPVLRTYVLSLIASGIVRDTKSLYAFFNDTFYAWQYGDTSKLHAILDKMVRLLAQWRFLEGGSSATTDDEFVVASDMVHDALRATPLGERVAQLYLDPYTAFHLINTLDAADARSLLLEDEPLLHLLCTTLEIRPLLNIKQSELDEIDAALLEMEPRLLVKSPSTYSHDYEHFLQTVKTAIALNAWIEEVGEDQLLEQYALSPGDLQTKKDIVDWLLYSLIELSKMLHWQSKIAVFERLRLRMEYGAKEDLLPLLRLKGIGRVRARKLVKGGIRTLDHVRNVDAATLKQLLGEKTAIDVKSQVGQQIEPSKLKVAPNKRKGQINLGDFEKN